MTAKEIRSKAAGALSDLLVGLRRQQFQLRSQRVLGQLKYNHKIRELRRDIARIKTVQRENLIGGKK
jgi:large subunit ribosomal protein L29